MLFSYITEELLTQVILSCHQRRVSFPIIWVHTQSREQGWLEGRELQEVIQRFHFSLKHNAQLCLIKKKNTTFCGKDLLRVFQAFSDSNRQGYSHSTERCLTPQATISRSQSHLKEATMEKGSKNCPGPPPSCQSPITGTQSVAERWSGRLPKAPPEEMAVLESPRLAQAC